MTSLRRSLSILSVFLLIAGFSAGTASADSSHARIVRVSYVQGDVRFARDVKGDPLSDSRGNWENAVLNLPIRQGYVLATDDGRAEVEFEDGARAFLAENTVLEFYDLSSEDGGFTTRLVLRQGSAEFYVNPGRGDFFSVTGGDFSVQAETKVTFRINNFDDGSNVSVLRGHLTALTNGKSTPLAKEQSLSLKAGEPESAIVEQAPAIDDFDQWASSRIDAANVATTAGVQYTSGYNGYTSGFGDLYTYGAWFPVAGYGYCWRPYGVGFGWSPFDAGSWYFDPFFGWGFSGSQPWGWLPYHYGGWLFRPGVGWVWNPGGSFNATGVGRWKPVTGTWVRSGGTVGIVPTHPLDSKGKTPLNFSSGVYAVTPRGVSGRVPVESAERWKVEGKPARDVLQNQLAQTSAPARVSRSMSNVENGLRTATGEAGAGIVYDRAEGRFVNGSGNGAAGGSGNTGGQSAMQQNGTAVEGSQVQGRAAQTPPRTVNGASTVPPASGRMTGHESGRASVPSGARSAAPPRVPAAPPSVPRSVVNERVYNGGGGGSSVGGAGRSGSSGGSSAGASSGRSSSGSAASSGSSASSGRSSSGSSGSSGGSGGGRPH